ncbi:hypothetical protein SAMD00023353_5400330 [Rosellinia necatrix]|uniref:Uncharacterized protein n=1 Tax=Rosellinia necatrix TaxID=77044 RepID=A0A1W2TRC7_ROSNE|nr:hypothetical protein SAMD00023353_5400330 [Rosellinia necatrix]
MCHYLYWGYDKCCHEYSSRENRWEFCNLGGRVDARYCPFVMYTRRKINVPFCDSCLDETPPSHPPVTTILQDLETMRSIMNTVGVERAFCIRYTREYRSEFSDISARAAAAGPNNNFYNDVAALYQIYYQRASDAVSRTPDGRAAIALAANNYAATIPAPPSDTKPANPYTSATFTPATFPHVTFAPGTFTTSAPYSSQSSTFYAPSSSDSTFYTPPSNEAEEGNGGES